MFGDYHTPWIGRPSLRKVLGSAAITHSDQNRKITGQPLQQLIVKLNFRLDRCRSSTASDTPTVVDPSKHRDARRIRRCVVGLDEMAEVRAARMCVQLLGSRALHFNRKHSLLWRGPINWFSAMRNDGNPTEAAPSRSFQMVVAATRELGIGNDGRLPWKLPSDLKFFKEITSTTSSPCKRNAVIMGRKTWESIPPMFRPLPGRLNVVLTRLGIPTVEKEKDNVVVCGSLQSALELLAIPPYAMSIETVFIIGGSHIYREAVNLPTCLAIHITEIENSFECDTFIPPLDMFVYRPWYSSFPQVENNIRYSIVTYVRCRLSSIVDSPMTPDELENGTKQMDGYGVSTIQKYQFLPKFIFESHEEFQYLRLIQDIISNGVEKGDQSGTGALSKFGCQMRFNLRKSFPLLMTKQVFWRGVVEELLWFISGSTNAKSLQEKGIHIWDGNATREYLDSIGLKEREEGDLGPIYGFQWRHFGAKYTDMHADYGGQGFDQLADIIHQIKSNFEDQHLILSAWNPADLKLMARPPCHMFAQFYVTNGEVSCQMYQRSCDMGLGMPFNIALYALLTCMIAHVCDLVPGDFVHVVGDVHVYKNHVVPLLEQLQNVPRPFPVLKINSKKMDIDSFVESDFHLIGYESHRKVEMKWPCGC